MGLLGLVLWPVRWLVLATSAIVPRDRRLWIFGSSGGARFADNAKWLFLHVERTRPDGVKAVWAARRSHVAQTLAAEGLPFVRMGTLRGVWTSMRAGVWIFDSTIWDIGYWTSARARKVNLWHGVPLKKVKIDIGNPTHPDRRVRQGSWPRRLAARLGTPWAAVIHHMVVATSSEVAARMATAFDVAPGTVAITGLARNDVLVARTPGLTRADRRDLATLHKREGPIVLYMPTFRDAYLRTGHEIPVDWSAVNDLMRRHGGVFLAKLHPRDSATLPKEGLSHMRFLPAAADPYPLLRLTDVLVTDYSSVYFDFLLLDRPVLFYPYDLDRYVSQDRPLYEAYDDATPGPKASTMPELLRLLDETLRDPAVQARRFAEARQRVRARLFTHVDADASERTAREILRRFGPRRAGVTR